MKGYSFTLIRGGGQKSPLQKFNEIHRPSEPMLTMLWKEVLEEKQLSPLGGIHVFCLNFPPLEYILTIPPHSRYIIVSLQKNHRCLQ